MTTLRLILGDQLDATLPIVKDAVKTKDVFLLAEVKEEATYVKHHKKKIALLFSAMRHFAQQLKQDGYTVVYRKYSDPNNQGSLLNEVARLCEKQKFDSVEVTEPGEFRLLKSMQQWQHQLKLPATLLPDPRFFCSTEAFNQWASDKEILRMEYFYRQMRVDHQVLIEQDNKPIGGKWNYDKQNREALPDSVEIPQKVTFEPDEITRQVIELVKAEFGDHFGEIDNFDLAVTREQALKVLQHFVEVRLKDFGQYQDAMKHGQPWLFHSHISFYINCGLLRPKEVVQAAEQAYHSGEVPLNSAEGFIRQILGWREFIRGFYWHFMPNLKLDNFFKASRDLPAFFWNGETKMNCLRQCINDTRENAYAHHIQRLMVLGNFCLLTEIAPEQVQEWYLLVYADAYEWVELPNVNAMILFADGGKLASKPYIASGNYINKMSDYCKHCKYKVSVKTGETACPFNYLYWRFVAKHQTILSDNPRMNMVMNALSRMSTEKLEAAQSSATRFLSMLSKNQKI
ncbi:cryptochrome/photolyase family protein [Alteromonas ponticola]|uniref:Cryptochrome/photolyase family protein n=1 Tax=Alteromonas ponticola TaxID=2720613 RepID=A0ABX1QW37_9ALTE|nr:cryptochrome/photolyase family protein [Alteromonas ponticola]NMH58415.1 cryptochrome/photolyase family protein [Alteromonas ponticola]